VVLWAEAKEEECQGNDTARRRPLKRESKLSQTPIFNAIHGKPIKLRTLTIIRQAAARLSAK
jgi:hypothetical protein